MTVSPWPAVGRGCKAQVYCIVASVVGLCLLGRCPSMAQSAGVAQAPSAGSGPYISNVTDAPLPRPIAGQSIAVTAIVEPQTAAVRAAALYYVVNFGHEVRLPMAKEAGVGAERIFAASIPATEFAAGDLVRWYVRAQDVDGQISRLPPYTSPKKQKYLGTVVTPEADDTFTSPLPVLEWFTNDTPAAGTEDGVNGSALYFLDRFYDNVHVERKGVTSLTWPKPKLKFQFDDKVFVWKEDLNAAAKEVPVDEFDINSLYWEPGQKSYMRESVAYQVLQQAGAPYAYTFYMIIRLNNAYWGLSLYIEDASNAWLERNGISKEGVLFKATSGSDANLRWDLGADQLQYYFKQENHKSTPGWAQLADLTRGIAGGSDELRSNWVFDNIDLPPTINQLAVNALLLNQDRCTKNWYMYQAPASNGSLWTMLSYDLKSALGADAGLHGRPAPDYCILECEQWNSPLYCDRNHPQDLANNATAPWTRIQATNPFNAGRRLMQAAATLAASAEAAAPAAAGLADLEGAPYNVDLTQAGPTPTGAEGTFNYLVDLIMDVPATREMFMRRLRTLMDTFLQGRLEQIITDTYHLIKSAADKDDTVWNIGSIDDGYEALTTEQLPPRKQQLYDTYGPSGTVPLIPDAQPAAVRLELGRTDAQASQAQQFVEIVNPNAFAVDVSGWAVTGDVSLTLKQGTVVASESSLLLVLDLPGFRTRSASPMPGEGLQVHAGYIGALTSNGIVTLVDGSGVQIFSSPIRIAVPNLAG